MWMPEMSIGTAKNDFAERRAALLREREGIAAELARLKALDESLIRQEERLKAIEEAADCEPYLVRIDFLLDALECSRDTFDRLRKNPAKGFPQAIEGIDSQPRWVWADVKRWIEQ